MRRVSSLRYTPLSIWGTDAVNTYGAASLYSVLVPERVKHRAVRELYVPDNAQELARRLPVSLLMRNPVISLRV